MSGDGAPRPGHRRVTATTVLRLGLLVLALIAALAVLAPPRGIARKFGWRFGRRSPVLFQRLLCAGLGVRPRLHGELSPDAGLIVANHVSWLDIPILGSLAPMSFLAKKEVGDHLIGRELVAMQGAVYVERGRRLQIPAVNAEMARTMREGSPVVLFAEATTGDGNRLLPFRSSHFEAIRGVARGVAGRPALIQPVFLHYSRLGGLPLGRAERPKVAWYGDMAFLPHLFAYLSGGGVTCDIRCGPPIRVPPDMDRKMATRLAEKAIRSLAQAARSG